MKLTVLDQKMQFLHVGMVRTDHIIVYMMKMLLLNVGINQMNLDWLMVVVIVHQYMVD